LYWFLHVHCIVAKKGIYGEPRGRA